MNTKRNRVKSIAGQLFTALLVATCVGLAIPHVIKWLCGVDNIDLDIYQLEECLEEHITKDSMEYIHKHISSIDDINAENLGIIITNVFRSSDNLPVYIIKNSQGNQILY